ncbi:hypothetical protein BKA62DRAFT_740885 [Auriculariales sp. MPI-PUGE-AT-0066]|nr:hypothetical protein BKA62DRAFT_740885 [Auriculariales sp. MPI-PUGE-AT-0066]
MSASSSSEPTPFEYNPSNDGTDTNLLILLHGLGDTAAPFGRLGKSLNLPQTATLALSGPESIPFDNLGEVIEHPNPTSAITFLRECLKHLVETCGWRDEDIHLFGFAQGGSVAGELALALARDGRRLGSIVSVCGPLYSFPAASSSTSSGIPVLVFDRLSAERSKAKAEADAKAWRRGFARVVYEMMPAGAGAGMPANKNEWGIIMAFWADVLQRRMPDGVYPVRR